MSGAVTFYILVEEGFADSSDSWMLLTWCNTRAAVLSQVWPQKHGENVTEILWRGMSRKYPPVTQLSRDLRDTHTVSCHLTVTWLIMSQIPDKSNINLLFDTKSPPAIVGWH